MCLERTHHRIWISLLHTEWALIHASHRTRKCFMDINVSVLRFFSFHTGKFKTVRMNYDLHNRTSVIISRTQSCCRCGFKYHKKYNIIFISMFSLMYNYLKIRTVAFSMPQNESFISSISTFSGSSSSEPAFLRRHVLTIAGKDKPNTSATERFLARDSRTP